MSTTNTTKIPLFNYIIENVKDGHFYEKSDWLACKCPYCDNDADKKRHFNIQLKEGQPLIYKCFRASCGVTGVLNRTICRDLGLTSITHLKEIQDSFNKNILIDANKRNTVKKVDDIDLGTITSEVNEYFKLRTGKELTKELQNKFRIFSSLPRLVVENKHAKIDEAGLDYRLTKELIYGEKYIHFLNHTNTMVYGRQINGDEKFKVSLVHVSNPLLTHMPYMFPSDGNEPYENVEDTLFIGEGTFDIINAYFYLFKRYKGVFMASSSFTSTNHLINFYTKFVYKPNIVILSDDDVDIKVYINSLKSKINTKRVSNIHVVYNKEGKDLGEYKGKSFKVDIFRIFSEEDNRNSKRKRRRKNGKNKKRRLG